MRILDLISDPLLRLELATPSSQASLAAEISSAVATESIDPAAYLNPGTLVLTTGMALNFDDPRIWEGYVERLAAAGTAAIAFGEGKPHTRVPQGLHDAATTADFPILVVPSDVPFLHLQNLVLRALSDEEHQAEKLGWSIAEEATKSAADGLEFAPLLERVAARVDCVLRVVDDEGAVFTGTDRLPWSHAEGGAELDATPLLSLPLNIGEDEQWHLQCHAPSTCGSAKELGAATNPDTTTEARSSQSQSKIQSPRLPTPRSRSTATLRTALTPAAAVLGMVLARSLGTSIRHSEKTDALLSALRQTDHHASAEIRTALEGLGVSAHEGIRMISVRARSPIRLHLLAWRLLRMLSAHVVVFPIDMGQAMLLLLVPFDHVRWAGSGLDGPVSAWSPRPNRSASFGESRVDPALRPTSRPSNGPTAAEHYLDEIAEAVNAGAGDCVLIGEVVRDVSALSLFTRLYAEDDSPVAGRSGEAVSTVGAEASNAVPTGVHFLGPPRLRDLAALIPPSLSAGVAHAVLGPVLGRSDRTTLLDSLAAFVETPSVAQAAARLGVHRNTARAHRNELEDALGIDLSSGDDRTMCAIALAALG